MGDLFSLKHGAETDLLEVRYCSLVHFSLGLLQLPRELLLMVLLVKVPQLARVLLPKLLLPSVLLRKVPLPCVLLPRVQLLRVLLVKVLFLRILRLMVLILRILRLVVLLVKVIAARHDGSAPYCVLLYCS